MPVCVYVCVCDTGIFTKCIPKAPSYGTCTFGGGSSANDAYMLIEGMIYYVHTYTPHIYYIHTYTPAHLAAVCMCAHFAAVCTCVHLAAANVCTFGQMCTHLPPPNVHTYIWRRQMCAHFVLNVHIWRRQ